MKILEENELNYSLEDIIDAINDELGFSFVKSSPSKGYFMMGNKINVYVDFSDEISVKIRFPQDEINMVEDEVLAEAYATAIESTSQIIDIINRMTGEIDQNDENSD